MGRSHGPGSPVWFRCHRCRSTLVNNRTSTWELTGRSRPARFSGAPGSRSTFREREYRCSCGHVGWSNHIDLARAAGETRYTGSRLEYLDEPRTSSGPVG